MKPINQKKIKRILITRIDRIGDVVLSTPVFASVKEQFATCHLAVLVQKGNEALVRGNPSVDEVLVLDKKGCHRSVWSTFWFGLGLRRYKFDAVINLHATARIHLLGWLAGIPLRIGFKKKNPWFLTHALEERKWQGRLHEAEYNYDLLEPLGIKIPKALRFYVPQNGQSAIDLAAVYPNAESRRYVVFHPTASCASKVWPAERMGLLANMVSESFQLEPAIVSGPDGLDDVRRMISALKVPYVNLSNRLSLGMLSSLLSKASLLVSNDSGPVHIAAAVGTPVISIFGRNQAGLSSIRWKPMGSRSSFIQKDVGCVECLADRCQIGFKCLEALTVDEVFLEVKKYEDDFSK